MNVARVRVPMVHLVIAMLTATVLVGVAAPPANAEPTLPDGFADETAFSGLNQPTVVRFSPDGRVFVAEKSGLIKVFDGLADGSPDIFADLRTQVHNFWDRGLLGLALHPQFPTDPRVYVLYTYDAPPGEVAPYWGQVGGTSDPCPSPPGATADGCVVQGHLSVLTAVAGQNTSDGNEQVLIEDWCQQYPSHSIGTIAFGPDGMLYASAGDGASFNFVDYGQDGSPVNPCDDPPNGIGGPMTAPSAEGGALRSQDLLTMGAGDPLSLDGAIIRVDPDTGAGLPTNPLAGTYADANADRLIAHGLRNPFRFAFRPGTDELWTGDVGWNRYEEINRITDVNDGTVENFGWPCYEGPGTQSGYDGANLTLCEDLYGGAGQDAPHYAYHHNDQIVSSNPCPTGGSSQAGVAFYTSGSYPAEYEGAMFAADYSRDCIWAMLPGADGVPSPSNRQRFVTAAQNPVHLEIGPGGDVFYVNFSGGTIQRVTYTSGNQSPVAVASATPTEGNAPLTVDFDATGSTDPDGDPLTFSWDLDGDGQFDDATGAQTSTTYTETGTVTASVQVTDPGGASGTDSVVITVNNTGPTASIDTPDGGFTWAVGDVIDFSGSATDAEDGPLPPSALDWSLILHHCDTPTTCHEHPVQDFVGTDQAQIVAPDHDYPSFLELRLTATDSGGLTDTASLELQPTTVLLSLETQPPGLDIALNGDADPAPVTREVIVGSTNTLTAPTPQVLDATSYEFSAWSDGGAATHNIVAPAADASYTATYQASTGLVAAYGFEAGSGATVADASGRGNDGTLNGASWAVGDGYHGTGVAFDGSNDAIDVVDHASLDLRDQLTLEAWVWPTTNRGQRAVLVKEGTSAPVYGLYASASGRRAAGSVSTSGTVTATGPRLRTGDWQHLAVTYDGAAVRLYVDGTLVGEQATSGLVTVSDGALRIGGSIGAGDWFAGRLDDVRVYNRALDAAQIRDDMVTPVEDEPPGNERPTALATVDCTALSCTYDGSASTDDGPIVSYVWDFGDGATASGEQATHAYAADGTYDVRLTVTDDGGLSHTTQVEVVVTSSTAPIALSATGAKVKGEKQVELAWSGASGPVDVLRNGSPVATAVTGGAYLDALGKGGGGSYAYQVCETGAPTECSETVTVQF